MARLLIEGGHPVSGELLPLSSKNIALPLIAAALLSDEPVVLTGMPAISDVRVMLKLLEGLGGEYTISNYGEHVTVQGKGLEKWVVHDDLAEQIRGSNLILAPLLARFGKAQAYYPGGDKIGVRNMGAHFDVFRQLGYKVEEFPEESYFSITKERDVTGNIDMYLYEASPTATENAIILSSVRNGQTIITNAACEVHVRDLCVLLKSMGADISGMGTNRIVIQGIEKLHGTEHYLARDNIYASSFIIFSLVTGGSLHIPHMPYADMLPILTVLKYFNVTWEITPEGGIYIPSTQDLRLNKNFNVYNNVGVFSDVWPKLPSDLLPLFAPLASQSEGTFLLFEKMYAGRLKYLTELSHLGANLTLLDDHRLSITGKTSLHAAMLQCPDIRSGVAYLAGMLAAGGNSILTDVYHIERTYPKIEAVLHALGANIIRDEESF